MKQIKENRPTVSISFSRSKENLKMAEALEIRLGENYFAASNGVGFVRKRGKAMAISRGSTSHIAT